MSEHLVPIHEPHGLRQAAHRWRRSHPGLPAEAAAPTLGLPAGLLIAAHAGIHPGEPADWRVVRLQGVPAAALATLLSQAPGELGWHQPSGAWRLRAAWQPNESGDSGELVDRAQALRWHLGPLHGLQLFASRQRFGGDTGWRLSAVAADGQLGWQWRLGAQADLDRFGDFLARWASTRLDAGLDPVCDVAAAAPAPAPVREAWLRTRCPQEAGDLQRRWGLPRRTLLALADPRYVEPVEPSSLPELLDRVLQEGWPVQLTLPQPGTRLAWTGRPAALAGLTAALGAWLDDCDSAWLVRQPTRRGTLHTLECFDAAGRPLLALRADPQAEALVQRAWLGLLAAVCDRPCPCPLA